MKHIKQAKEWIKSEEITETLSVLSGGIDKVPAYRQRLLDAVDGFVQKFGSDREIAIFSVPGRTELGGNHTDHQRGHVLAASVNLDMIAVVAWRTDETVCVQTAGMEEDVVQLSELEPMSDKIPTAAELIRGVLARFRQYGCSLQTGFDAYTVSDVTRGAGLSSSAAFEVLIGMIGNALYAENRFHPVELAQFGQYAENVYFQKPCGLMDQIACAVGGVVEIDFHDPTAPVVHTVPFDFSKTGYLLCIVEVGDSHADLTEAYAAIPAEMGKVAAYFGKEVLSEVSASAFYQEIPALRKACGDRAVLRAMHFFREDVRAIGEADALKRGDFEAFLHLVQNSGRSSDTMLQNIYPASAPAHQPISIALAVGGAALGGRGAIRVHGGGFGGTIQAFVPSVLTVEFQEAMEQVFGTGCCHMLQIRPVGGMTLLI